MVLTGLDDECYKDIWNAPDGHDYAVQFRRQGEQTWIYSDFAMSHERAVVWITNCTQTSYGGSEYRLVKLSRYPPCSITQIIRYYKDKE